MARVRMARRSGHQVRTGQRMMSRDRRAVGTGRRTWPGCGRKITVLPLAMLAR